MRATPRDFWSRRRAGVAAEAEGDAAVEVACAAQAQEAQLAERTDEEILAELDLPEPEALESPDQVRDFLSSAVPQRLKTRALRRLWRLNPVLANVDGLVDYGEDFTDAAMILENMQTVYQVGKGMLTALIEEEEEAAESPETDPADEHAPDMEEPQIQDTAPPVHVAATFEPDQLPEPDPAPVAMPQRRMRFAFDTA